jgi:hypothetical protein
MLKVVTIGDVRWFAATLPRTTEALVAGRVKFRVGRIVYLAFSRDEAVMGFAFPKEERDWLVGGSPDKFMQPDPVDLRYNWVQVRLAAIEESEMRELVLDAWRMVVPKGVAAAYPAYALRPPIGRAPLCQCLLSTRAKRTPAG